MKVFKGKVISKKMAKTATVLVERVVTHPVYGRKIRRGRKYQVHDELNVEVGKTVLFTPSRPFSRLKRWKIVKVLDGKDGKTNAEEVVKKIKNKDKSRSKEAKKK